VFEGDPVATSPRSSQSRPENACSWRQERAADRL